MSDRAKLADLQKVARLMLDLRLLALDQAAKARQASLDHLDELNRPQPAADPNPIVAGEVAVRYQHWADQRRASLNLDLARQTAEWQEARQAASLALGRDAVIARLRERLK